MKVKAINRSATESSRERSQDLQKVHKNLDPALHPFEKAVEYTRALNAVKLDRCGCGQAGGCSWTAWSLVEALRCSGAAQDLCQALPVRLSP